MATLDPTDRVPVGTKEFQEWSTTPTYRPDIVSIKDLVKDAFLAGYHRGWNNRDDPPEEPIPFRYPSKKIQ